MPCAPLDYLPDAYLRERRSGRFDDSLEEYYTLYCAGHQTVALRESLSTSAVATETLAKLKSV